MSGGFLLYVATAAAVVVVPGPTVMICVAHGMRHGARAAMATVGGICASHVGMVALTAAGLVPLIERAPWLIPLLTWAGVAYLAWAAWATWRSAGEVSVSEVAPAAGEAPGAVASAGERTSEGLEVTSPGPERPRPWTRLAYEGAAVNLSNPKTWIFYSVFFPPFLEPELALGPQYLQLGGTFVLLVALGSAAYAWLGAAAAAWLEGPGQARASAALLALAAAGLVAATR